MRIVVVLPAPFGPRNRLDFQHLSLHQRLDAGGRVTGDESASVHQPYPRTALRLIHIGCADNDADAFQVQVAEDVPKLAA